MGGNDLAASSANNQSESKLHPPSLTPVTSSASSSNMSAGPNNPRLNEGDNRQPLPNGARDFGDRTIKYTYPRPPNDKAIGPLNENFKFFLANLPAATNPTNIREFFGKLGMVNYVKLIYDKRTDKLLGYGFLYLVDYESDQAVYNYAAARKFRVNFLGSDRVYVQRNDDHRVRPLRHKASHDEDKMVIPKGANAPQDVPPYNRRGPPEQSGFYGEDYQASYEQPPREAFHGAYRSAPREATVGNHRAGYAANGHAPSGPSALAAGPHNPPRFSRPAPGPENNRFYQEPAIPPPHQQNYYDEGSAADYDAHGPTHGTEQGPGYDAGYYRAGHDAVPPPNGHHRGPHANGHTYRSNHPPNGQSGGAGYRNGHEPVPPSTAHGYSEGPSYRNGHEPIPASNGHGYYASASKQPPPPVQRDPVYRVPPPHQEAEYYGGKPPAYQPPPVPNGSYYSERPKVAAAPIPSQGFYREHPPPPVARDSYYPREPESQAYSEYPAHRGPVGPPRPVPEYYSQESPPPLGYSQAPPTARPYSNQPPPIRQQHAPPPQHDRRPVPPRPHPPPVPQRGGSAGPPYRGTPNRYQRRDRPY